MFLIQQLRRRTGSVDESLFQRAAYEAIDLRVLKVELYKVRKIF